MNLYVYNISSGPKVFNPEHIAMMGHISFMYILRHIRNRISSWRKKPRIVYVNAGDTSCTSSSESTPPTLSARSVPAAQSVPIFEFTRPLTNIYSMNSSNVTTNDDLVSASSAEAQAVATGVDQKQQPGRKSRVRKSNATPRVAVVKKKKEPKPPRNPFRRSETVKLQLKSLQMGKRVETMTPRVSVLRERLETMQQRLDFVAGKLKLVKEELASREDLVNDETVSAEATDDSMEVSDEVALGNALEQLPQ